MAGSSITYGIKTSTAISGASIHEVPQESLLNSKALDCLIRMVNKMSLKLRVIFLAALAIVSVAVVLVTVNLMGESTSRERLEELAIDSTSGLWAKEIQFRLDTLAANQSTFTRNRDLGKALKKGDKDAIAEAAAPTFNRLSTSGFVTHVLVASWAGDVLFEIAEGNEPSGHELIAKVINTGKVQRGISAGKDQVVSASLAFPLYYRGKPIGVGVYGISGQTLIEELKEADHAEVMIVSQGSAIHATTSKEISSQWGAKNKEISSQAEWDEIEFDHAIYATTILPLSNSLGLQVGNLVVLTDQTELINDYKNKRIVGYLAVIAALLISLGLLFWQIQSAFKPLDGAIGVMKAISEGDLTHNLDDTGENEIGVMLQSMNVMQIQLRQMISTIDVTARDLLLAANSTLAVTEQMNSDVKKQQVDTQDVAQYMSRMSQAVSGMATDALGAADKAVSSENAAREGQSVVKETASVIRDLAQEVDQASVVIGRVEKDSEDIGNIIEVIRGIAEQTNLLALNAAIEAARAGEMGRGFAVVADEVRTLATRTQQSTQEIQEMIDRLQLGTQDAVQVMQRGREKAEVSVDKAIQAGNSLGEITMVVVDIRKMNTKISDFASEQGNITAQMEQSVNNISDISQKTAAGAQETSVAFNNVTRLASEVRELVNRFTT